MATSKLINIELELQWKSTFAEHNDVFYAIKVDPSIDILPAGFAAELIKLKKGESYSKTFQALDLLGEGYS